MKHHHKKPFKIYKSSGNIESFDPGKLCLSLERSGISRERALSITNEVSSELGEGSLTRDIYRKAFQLVKQTSPLAAAQYSLKKALFELGPTGHHFETFVARYFEALGYETQTCKVFYGELVKHEIDVVAKKREKLTLVECKFHNRLGIKNDIKIALYVKARRDDLLKGPAGKTINDFYLVSNTAFTTDALTYAKGSGLHLLGVNAPVEEPFLEQIKRLHLFPITSLRRINKLLKSQLLAKNLVLATDVMKNRSLLAKMGVSDQMWPGLAEEVGILENGK